MRDFKKLEVWQDAHTLTLKIYKLSKTFPKEELYGLTSQIRRACMSVPTNIAEGCGRATPGELKRFCDFAMGSASEVEYQLLLAKDLSYIDSHMYDEINQEFIVLKKRLNSFIQRLKAK